MAKTTKAAAPGVDAHDPGVGERVAGDALQDGAGDAERRAGEDAEQRARNPQLAG